MDVASHRSCVSQARRVWCEYEELEEGKPQGDDWNSKAATVARRRVRLNLRTKRVRDLRVDLSRLPWPLPVPVLPVVAPRIVSSSGVKKGGFIIGGKTKKRRVPANQLAAILLLSRTHLQAAGCRLHSQSCSAAERSGRQPVNQRARIVEWNARRERESLSE